MTQNTSTAVMQRRAPTAADALDYFPTPPWATRALCEWLMNEAGEETLEQSAWEPACGEMHMAAPLAEYFESVRASDCHPYTPDVELLDFLMPGLVDRGETDWTITNPPFKLAQQFIETALLASRRGCAMFLRSAFLEGQDRYRTLFSTQPPTAVLQFSERVCLLQERLVQLGKPDPFNLKDGAPVKAATATSYVWLVWQKGAMGGGTTLHWIPPCREHLERPSDYPAYGSGETRNGVSLA